MATPPRCVPKNTFYFSNIREDGSCKITFNSAFDSGNLSQVEQNSTTHVLPPNFSSNLFLVHSPYCPRCPRLPFPDDLQKLVLFFCQGRPKRPQINLPNKKSQYSLFISKLTDLSIDKSTLQLVPNGSKVISTSI